MGGLFSALQNASTALNVFTQALGVDQSNVSNTATQGYAAQRTVISPVDLSGDGTNPDFVHITSTGNALADATVRAATSQSSQSQTSSSLLSPINQMFDITGSSGILAAFQQFSSAFANLSVNPNDPTLGSLALTAAGGVATAFNSVSTGLQNQSNQLGNSLQSTVGQINSLASSIGKLNVQMTSSGQDNPALEANMRSDLDQLSSLVDVTVNTASDGSVSVLAGGQLPLVIGNQSYTLSGNLSAAPGSQMSSSAGGNSPTSFSGQLGAILDTQNNTISPLLGANGQPGSLNTLAAGFASQVNTLLSSGVTTSGAAGVPLFTYDTSPNSANVAQTLAVDPGVTADQLGLGTTGGSPTSNGIANQLAGLADSTSNPILGISATAMFGSLASSVGQHLSDANTASSTDQSALTTAQANRQQTSGVSLDLEATNITAFERAYEANAQVVSILGQLTEDAINIGTPSSG